MMKIKVKRWVKWAVVCTAAVALVGAGLTYYLLQRPPKVWTQAQEILDSTTPEQRKEKAQDVVKRLSDKVDGVVSLQPRLLGEQALGVGKAAPGKVAVPTTKKAKAAAAAKKQAEVNRQVDQTHKLKLTNKELVSVVGEFFDDWTAQRGFQVPNGIKPPVVMSSDGRLAIAFEVNTPSWSQVFSGYIELEFKPDGMARGRVDELVAGSLPVSIDSVADMIRKNLPKSEAALAQRIGEWLEELEGFEFRPVMELEHRRRARVVGVAIVDSGVELTMRVQDHQTYKRHNALMKDGRVAVTDTLKRPAPLPDPKRDVIVDVPTTTD